MTERAYVLEPHDISVTLLVALAKLPAYQRTAWIDAYVLGLPQRNRTLVMQANERLRGLFGSADNLREAA